jgi:dephospho-CoA kinase
MQSLDDISYFARTNDRRPMRVFGIRQKDRLSHLHIVGRTGTGKSTLLETLISQDIRAGRGCALVDPHGDLVERIAAVAASHRPDDTIYLDAADIAQPYGYNPLKLVALQQRPLAASGLMEVFKKMWPDAWGQRMEHILRNALLLLLDQPHATLADVPKLFVDDNYRRSAVRAVTNEQVRLFWRKEYPKYSYRYRADAIAPIQNKVGAFLADPRLKHILTEPEKPLSFRRIMDEGRVLLVNLSKGRIGSDSASLLGGMLVTAMSLAAFSRADMPEISRRPFYLFIDEFQEYTTLAVANMASELRKYRVGLTLAHQHLTQLDPEVRSAVLGNAGTLISFRLGAEDATFLAKEFTPVFRMEDLLSLPNHQIYLKLMIDGMPSKPFSATTLRQTG